MFKFRVIVNCKFSVSLMKELKRILQHYWRKNKCLFIRLYPLEFTANVFKAIYYCEQASNMETTVSKEFYNNMKKIFKFCTIGQF